MFASAQKWCDHTHHYCQFSLLWRAYKCASQNKLTPIDILLLVEKSVFVNVKKRGNACKRYDRNTRAVYKTVGSWVFVINPWLFRGQWNCHILYLHQHTKCPSSKPSLCAVAVDFLFHQDRRNTLRQWFSKWSISTPRGQLDHPRGR